jgi:tetratricopeptide (TPR) repeat protein
LVDGLKRLVGSNSRVEQQRLAVLGALRLEIELVGRLFGDLRQLLLQSCGHGADWCRLEEPNCLGLNYYRTKLVGGLEMEMAATEILSCVSPFQQFLPYSKSSSFCQKLAALGVHHGRCAEGGQRHPLVTPAPITEHRRQFCFVRRPSLELSAHRFYMSVPSKEVPKFSSFRAKKPAPQEQTSLSSTTRKRHPSPERDNGPVKFHKSARQEHSSRRHRSSPEHRLKTSDSLRRDRDQLDHGANIPKSTTLVRHDETSHLFVADGKGDQQNVAYERLHKYSIPPYHRVGYGNILGLHLRFKIDRAESTLDKVVVTDKSAIHKQVPQRMLLKRQRNQELSALHVRDEDELDLAQGFVVFPPSTTDHDHQLTDDGYDSFKYLSRSTDFDSHNPQQGEILHEASAAELQIRQQNVRFVRATKSDPSDTQAWINLANHQEHLDSPGADAQSLTNTERQTLADMRIAVYEKALKHFPASEAAKRERLVLELLHEASLAWDVQKYTHKLQEILEQHPENFSIWTRYLNACQANPIDFHFEDVKAFFIRSLRTLSSKTEAGHDFDTRNMLLYLVLRYTVFLLDTGYDELSIATWQALCEYHLFRPEHLVSLEDSLVLADFEQFWENENPRFGEVGAQGWFATSEGDAMALDMQDLPPKDKFDPKLPFKSFSVLERTTCKLLQFPGRTMNDTGADDPFHIVFFSDIRGVIEATSAGFNHLDLLDAILCYLGLPSVSLTMTTGNDTRPQPAWRSDVLLRNGLLQLNPSAGDGGRMNGQRIDNYQTSTDLLFSRVFQDLLVPASDENAHNQQPTQEVMLFARRVLLSMVNHFPSNDDIAEYYLAFMLSCFPNEASKAAKSILKQRPSSPQLYNACATIAAKLGQTERAAQIWSGAINMKDSFSHAAQEELILLWRGWIWCDLEADQPHTALSHLASFGSNMVLESSGSTLISSATLLRLRNAFRDGFEHALGQSQPKLTALNAEMLALVAYLTESDALQASVESVHEQCNAAQRRLSNDHALIEMLHQVKAGIIAYHIRQRRPYRPAFVRFELETSIARFPDNTIFLEMYRDNEARFRLDDRVRSILKTQVLTHGQSPLVTWSFTINQELFRYKSQSSGSTAESVRSTFNRALMTVGSPVRYSQLLWVMWFRFEKQAAQAEATKRSVVGKRGLTERNLFDKLKHVFLSGLHHLPWSKNWVLLGLETFDRDDELRWSTQDLKRLYDVLVERELRIRVDGVESLLNTRTNDR